MVFTNLCFLVDEKIKLKILACFFEITYQLWKSFRNPLQRPYTLQRRFLTYWKCIHEAACDKLILAHFSCSQWESAKVYTVSFWHVLKSPIFQVEDPKLIVSFHLTGPLQPLNSALAHPLLNLLDVHLDLAKQVQGCSHSALLRPIDVSNRPRQAGTMLQPLSYSLAQWCFN